MSFYDHDRELIDVLARFVADGLALGERVLVVATPSHRLGLDAALHTDGIHVARERLTRHFVSLDAASTLATFMSDGRPDTEGFLREVGKLVADAGADGTPVRVFGEMVSLLWDQDNVAAAIELEELWNSLAEQADFNLLCAYPTAGLDGARLGDIRNVCAVHSTVVPPLSYAAGGDSGDDVGGHYTQVFLPVPEAIVAVRRFVTGVLRLWHEDDLVPDAELVASELATNAVLHADSPFRVSLDRSIGVVCIAIQDAVGGRAEQQPPTREDMGGRGMAIVDALSRRWGCDALPAGKVVWAELVAERGQRSAANDARA